MKKDQYIAAHVERCRVVEGDLGQPVVDVECLLVVEAFGELAVTAVGATHVVFNAEEAEVDKTTEEDDGRQVDMGEEIEVEARTELVVYERREVQTDPQRKNKRKWQR